MYNCDPRYESKWSGGGEQLGLECIEWMLLSVVMSFLTPVCTVT